MAESYFARLTPTHVSATTRPTKRVLCRGESKMVECPFGFGADTRVLIGQQGGDGRHCGHRPHALQTQRSCRVAASDRVGIVKFFDQLRNQQIRLHRHVHRLPSWPGEQEKCDPLSCYRPDRDSIFRIFRISEKLAKRGRLGGLGDMVNVSGLKRRMASNDGQQCEHVSSPACGFATTEESLRHLGEKCGTYSTPNLWTVNCSYFSPGRSTVEGNSGRLGESG